MAKKLLKRTASLCPECLKTIPAEIFERAGKVWISKKCPRHGPVEEIYWGDAKMYHRAESFARDGIGVSNPQIKKKAIQCPRDCGLCSIHKSHTALSNIAVTNRCDLSCWYCFFFAKRMGYVYEPTKAQIRQMMRNLRGEKPVPNNALQLSVDGDERIFLKAPDDTTVSEKIGRFVDEIMENKATETRTKPIEHERVDMRGWEVLTMGRNLKTTFKPIKHIIRHKNKERLFRIKTECGWDISTTGSHSIFVLENGDIMTKAVSSIKTGDVLLGSLELPLKNKLKEVNILKLMERRRPDVLEKIVICGFPRSKLKYFEKVKGRKISWDSVSYNTYTNSNKKYGKCMRYFNSTKGKELPIKLKITPELCRLLGYYTGEGCTYKNGIIFTFSLKEKQMLEDLEHCVRKVFGETNIRKREYHGSAVQFCIEGYLYRIFFDILGAGKIAKEKKVPWIIFNVSDRLKKEFLRTYFRCDGNVKMRKSGFEINHNTVSKELASDLVWLHLNFGVLLTIETSISKPHLIKKTGQFIRTSSKKFRIVIDGKENLSKVLWYLNSETARKFKRYALSKERHSPSYLRIPITKNIGLLAQNRVLESRISYLLERTKYDKSVSKGNLMEITDFFSNEGMEFDNRWNDLSHSNLGFFKVRKITRIKPHSKYVYDISVPETEAFFAGIGPLLAHNTGGEPTLRKDIVDIIKMAKQEGFDHVQLNTNGIRLSQDRELVKHVRKAGVNTLYLSYDGMTAKTNPKNHWEIPGVMENCRKADIGIVLVPTIIKGVNDHELGDMIKFGFKNIDVIRSVNFQPVSLVGKISKADRKKLRITIPDCIKNIEKQTQGQIGKEDFYPVPTIMPVTRFVEALTKKPEYALTAHPHCGMATYVFDVNGKLTPITRFVDVEGLLNYLDEKADQLEQSKANRYVTGLKLLWKIGSFIDKKKAPRGFSLAKIIYNALIRHDYNALGKFHYKSLFIGMMHFMDLANYDIERVKRCCIHYAMTDNRIIPFCAFNVIPEWYRDKSQESQGVSFSKWEKRTGRKLKNDVYRRDVKALANTQAYRKVYKDSGG